MLRVESVPCYATCQDVVGQPWLQQGVAATVRPAMVTAMAGENVHLLAQKVHKRMTSLREAVTDKESSGWSSSETSSSFSETDS